MFWLGISPFVVIVLDADNPAEGKLIHYWINVFSDEFEVYSCKVEKL